MLSALDVGNGARNANVEQPILDNKWMKMSTKEGEIKDSNQMRKVVADISVIKRDLAKLSNMEVEICNLKLQLKDSKQNPEN